MRRDSNTCSTDTDTDTSNSHNGLCTGNGISFPTGAGSGESHPSFLLQPARPDRKGLGHSVTCCQPRAATSQPGAVPSHPQVPTRCQGPRDTLPGEGRAVSLTPNRGHTVVTVLPPESSVSHRPGGQRTVKFSSLPTDKPTSGEPKTLRNL